MTPTTRNEGFSVEFQPMSPEELERTVQFLLHHQAQFAADMETLTVKMQGLTEKMEVLTEKMDVLTERIDVLALKTDHIADGLIGLISIVGQVAAAQQRTSELLDRHLREDHGRPPS